jgi:hypothetical protein
MLDPKLKAKAEQIARPCVLLKHSSADGQLAGVWGGPGIVPSPDGPYRHWLSIDCRFLPQGHGPSSGVLSVYSNEEDCQSGTVAFEPTASVSPGSGEPLVALAGISLPPPDAFPGGDTPDYIRLWQSNCPLYTEEASAVLGGWHFPWPDGDWEERRKETFVLWTIEDSEPWVEVWKLPDRYRVMQRIT